MFELKNKKIDEDLTKSVTTTKSQMDRSSVTIGFLSKNKAPPKFRESTNDAHRSRVLDKTLGGYPDNKYPSEAFHIKRDMKHVLDHGETGRWCEAMMDIRVYELIDGEINCASVIRKLHELWVAMDKDEIKKILEIDFLSKFGDCPNIILGDKVNSSDEFVNVMTHIIYSEDYMRDDFRRALESSQNPTSLPTIVINKRFKKDTSLLEAYDVVTNSDEWMHPDVKSFFPDGELCMFFTEDCGIAIKDYISQGLLLKNIPVRDTPGSVTSQSVRGSGLDNVVQFVAGSYLLSEGRAAMFLRSPNVFRCDACGLNKDTSFVDIGNERDSYLKCLDSNDSFSKNPRVCKECIVNSNTVETEKNVATCLLCNEKKNSFLTCRICIMKRGTEIDGRGLCTECIDNIEFKTEHDLLYGYVKRSRACTKIQEVGRKYAYKRSLDELRCEPDNLFNAEHGQLRKKILKIDDSGFG